MFLRGRKSSTLQKPWHGRPAVCSQASSTLDPLCALWEENENKTPFEVSSPTASIVLKGRWLPSPTKDLRIHAFATPHLRRWEQKNSALPVARELSDNWRQQKPPPAMTLTLGSPCPARHLLNSPSLPTNCLCFTAKPCCGLGTVIFPPPPPFYKGGKLRNKHK